ncbi:S41 family peptidase [Tissierella sp. MB52-C2]|uniref:S41 family peptidase n=1 Tax=Tissierella sp. MB52-C2 TaxID=3070999 RepID=UPI00280BD3C5|nr:S41 family peptidase [Tissierella sp. MB52-C2]WMM26955.1 S41 family peptidase [Tissierella sp. MB52-C2]
MWLVIVLCFFMMGCSAKYHRDNNMGLEQEGIEVSQVFYNIKEKKANNNEFDKGSKIEEIIVSEEKINDLTLLGKIWGYLKYYHPNVSKGKYNWDYELFRVLPKILDTENITERDEILFNWIESQGEFEVIEDTKVRSEKTKIIPDLEWTLNSDLDEKLVLQLSNIKDAKRTGKNYYVSFIEGVKNPEFKNENPYPLMEYSDTGYRLLSLYRYWNIIEYYFPYKHLIEEDWDDVLREFIPKFIEAENELEYKLTVLELIGRVNDTHANVYNDKTLLNHWGINFAPVRITFVENKAVVTGYHDNELGEKSGLKVGDIITKVNNKTVEDIVEDRLKYTPASNYPTKLRDIAISLLRTKEDSLDIEFLRDGKIESVQIQCLPATEMSVSIFKPEDTHFKFINPDIAYIYPGLIKNKDIPEIMTKIKDTKGLIIDWRCYPSDFTVFTLGQHLLPQSTEFVKFTQGSISEPGLFEMTEPLEVGKENSDYYKGKVVIIINELTQSSAEYHTMAFRTAPNAVVIGSTTAGADGNVSQFSLPGGINTGMSGIGVYYPDGTETQRIGIVPDIEIRPTIEGVKEGRDELLEKAIKIINE